MRTVDALKPLTAGELLELWRYYRERVEDPLERTLLCNAAILRDSCYCQGEAVYGDELEALRDRTPGEMDDLLLPSHLLLPDKRAVCKIRQLLLYKMDLVKTFPSHLYLILYHHPWHVYGPAQMS